MKKPRILNNFYIELPHKRILSRMGYNFHLTELDENQNLLINQEISRAFSFINITSGYIYIPIISIENPFVFLNEGIKIESNDICKLLNGCNKVLFVFATGGKEIIEQREKMINNDDLQRAVIYDAVGSESVDVAVDRVEEIVRSSLVKESSILTKRRFSPGYGDLKLEFQRVIFDLFGMAELGISISESYVLNPEKTVTAIYGVYSDKVPYI